MGPPFTEAAGVSNTVRGWQVAVFSTSRKPFCEGFKANFAVQNPGIPVARDFTKIPKRRFCEEVWLELGVEFLVNGVELGWGELVGVGAGDFR